MNLKTVILLLGVFLAQVSCAHAESVQDALNAQFKNKVLVLLHPSSDESLRFDSDGRPADATPLGFWTAYGGVKIEKIHLQTSKLRVEGHRMFFRFDSSGPV